MADDAVPFTADTDFRHHKTSYEKDTEYTGPVGLVTYFVMNGWASSPLIGASGEPVDPSEVDVTLDVHDVLQQTTSETGN
jgi:hypothetical protein